MNEVSEQTVRDRTRIGLSRPENAPVMALPSPSGGFQGEGVLNEIIMEVLPSSVQKLQWETPGSISQSPTSPPTLLLSSLSIGVLSNQDPDTAP